MHHTDDPLARSQEETRSAFANRALIYAHILDELTAEIGRERAVEVMRRAIYKRGLEVAEKYRAAAEAGRLAEVGRIFCEGSPCGGELFHPAIEELADDSLTLTMYSCPLVEAWREAGLADSEIDTLCEVAAAVDEGTFEGAGLHVEIRERLGHPGDERCLLIIRR
ncbi:MAG: hypothetical protein Kow0056_13460 [Coriobacteriia bacterium]